nr:glycosyltransferase family 2 protein [Variovorax dokdonensis]
MKSSAVTAVVVTYNRISLLRECIASLQAQTWSPATILVVNNASSDATREYLDALAAERADWLKVVHLSENTGGAGGFAEGLRQAVASGAEWTWMMDDDACPHPTALDELLKVAVAPENVYGSLAVNGINTSWSTTLLDQGNVVHFAKDVPAAARVDSIPLLGFLIHRSLVDKIGYPDAGFFIAADDVEYCVRARHAGSDIVIAGNSRIEHPRTELSEFRFLGMRVAYLSLPPWKRYYDTRNRIFIARRYYGIKLYSQTIPGSFVRLVAALLKEPRKLAQFKAFFAGFIDGLLGIDGKRHELWKIK